MNMLGLALVMTGGGWIFYQDITSRWIHIASFIIFAFGVFLNTTNTLATIGAYFFINALFFSLVFAVLKVQLYIKKGKNERIVNRYVGLGDVFLFLTFCFAFNLYSLIVFIITSCFFSIIYSYFRSGIFRKKTIRIPLAGIMAINFIVLNFINPFLSNTNVYFIFL